MEAKLIITPKEKAIQDFKSALKAISNNDTSEKILSNLQSSLFELTNTHHVFNCALARILEKSQLDLNHIANKLKGLSKENLHKYNTLPFLIGFILTINEYPSSITYEKPFADFLVKQGHPMNQVSREALTYYQMSANDGYAPAQLNIADIYASGTGIHDHDINANIQAAFLCCETAANNGHPRAQLSIAIAYANGIEKVIPKKNPDQAFIYAKKASEQGYPRHIVDTSPFREALCSMPEKDLIELLANIDMTLIDNNLDLADERYRPIYSSVARHQVITIGLTDIDINPLGKTMLIKAKAHQDLGRNTVFQTFRFFPFLPVLPEIIGRIMQLYIKKADLKCGLDNINWESQAPQFVNQIRLNHDKEIKTRAEAIKNNGILTIISLRGNSRT
jgi:hypothetical protein